MGIKRPVVQADTSGQLSLHLDDNDSAVEQLPSSTTRVFIESDPQYMNIGLKQHLQRSGHEHVFVIDEFLKQQDWSMFEANYAPTGRAPYAPRVMVALILYGIMQGKSSLRQLESLSRDSVGCLWLTGGAMPDHSIIGRFICRHSQVLGSEFFLQLTRSVLSYTGSGVAQTAGDGTVIESAASRYATIRREALEKHINNEQQRLNDHDDEDNPSGPGDRKRCVDRLNKLTAAEERLRELEDKRRSRSKSPEGIQINPEDPDAVNQPLKQQGYGLSYKPGVVANEHRVIVGHAVDATSEPIVGLEGLAQARQLGELKESSWDAGYDDCRMLLQQAAYGIDLYIPEGQYDLHRKNDTKKYPKRQFIYDAAQDAYVCPAGALLTARGRYKATATQAAYTRYRTHACGDCKQRAHCTTSKTGREIKRSEHDYLREQMREKMQDEVVQELYKKRAAWVEPVFSNMRMQQGLTRFRRKGLAGVKTEFGLHVLAHNLSRVVACWRRSLDLLSFLRLYKLHSPLLRALRALLNPKPHKSLKSAALSCNALTAA